MTLAPGSHRGPIATHELVAALLLTSATGSAVELVARDGQRLRLAADEATARELAISFWRALDRND
jgi:hypothetical protein